MTKQEIKQILLDNSIEQNGNQVFDDGNLEVCAMELHDKINKSEDTNNHVSENSKGTGQRFA